MGSLAAMDTPTAAALVADQAPATRRRAALAAVLRDYAQPILDTVVTEALRATDFVGLGQAVAARYALEASNTLPLALASLEADDSERERLLRQLALLVKDLRRHGVPQLVQLGLARVGFRIASGILGDKAATTEFTADELVAELRLYQRAFEDASFRE